MSKIIIKRTNEWMNRARKIGVYLDDKKLDTVSNGEAKEFDIPSGRHKIRAKIDWCGSQDLDCQINENEIKTLTISSYKYSKYLTIGYLPITIYILVKIFSDTKSSLLLTICFILILCILIIQTYFVTLGRNSYLRILENQTDS